MQKHQEHKVKKEVELQRQMNKTAFERVIEERARKLESVSFVLVTLKKKIWTYMWLYCNCWKLSVFQKEKADEKNSSGAEPEFMKVRAKLQAKMETKWN